MLEEYRAYLEDIHKCLGRAGVHLDLDFTGGIDSLYQAVDVLEQYLFYNKMLQVSDSGYKISILDYNDQVLFTDLLKRSFKEEFRVRLQKEQERELETPPDPLASGGVVKPMSLNLRANSDFGESEMDLSSDLTDEDALSAEEAEKEQNAALSASQQFMQRFNLVHRSDEEVDEGGSSNSGIYVEDEPVVESNFVDFEEEMEEEEAEEEDAAWAEQSSESSEDFDAEDESPFVDFETEDDDWEEESEVSEDGGLDEPDDDWEEEEEVSLEEYDSNDEDDDDWGDNTSSAEDFAEPAEDVFEEDDDDDWSSESEEELGTFVEEDDEDDWDNPETFENSSEELPSDSGSFNLVSADESVDDADVFVEDSDDDEFGYEDYSDEVEFGVSEADDTDSSESSDEDFDDEEDWGSNTDSEDDEEFGADSDDDSDDFGADSVELESSDDYEDFEDEEEFGVDSEDDEEDWGSEPEDTSDDEEDWSNDPVSLESDLDDDEDWEDFSTDNSTSAFDEADDGEDEDEDWGSEPEPNIESSVVEDEDDYDYDAEEEDWGDPINGVNSLAPDPEGSDYFTFDKPIGGIGDADVHTPVQQSAPIQASEQASGMQQDSFVSVSDTVQSMAEGIVGAVGKLFGRASRQKDSQNNSK